MFENKKIKIKYPDVESFEKWWKDSKRQDQFFKLPLGKERKKWLENESNTIKKFRNSAKIVWKKMGMKNPDKVEKALEKYANIGSNPNKIFGSAKALNLLDNKDWDILNSLSRKLLKRNEKLYRASFDDENKRKYISYSTKLNVAKNFIAWHNNQGSIKSTTLDKFKDKKIIALQKLGFEIIPGENEVIVKLEKNLNENLILENDDNLIKKLIDLCHNNGDSFTTGKIIFKIPIKRQFCKMVGVIDYMKMNQKQRDYINGVMVDYYNKGFTKSVQIGGAPIPEYIKKNVGNLNEEFIGSIAKTFDVQLQIDKTNHATLRQHRKENDFISDQEIKSVIDKAMIKIVAKLLIDKIFIGDKIHIYDSKTDLNIVGQIKLEQNNKLEFVIITIMREKNFRQKPDMKFLMVK